MDPIPFLFCLFLGFVEEIEGLLEGVPECLGGVLEHDDPLLALGVRLRDGQVRLVVLCDPHVDEAGVGLRGDVY